MTFWMDSELGSYSDLQADRSAAPSLRPYWSPLNWFSWRLHFKSFYISCGVCWGHTYRNHVQTDEELGKYHNHKLQLNAQFHIMDSSSITFDSFTVKSELEIHYIMTHWPWVCHNVLIKPLQIFHGYFCAGFMTFDFCKMLNLQYFESHSFGGKLSLSHPVVCFTMTVPLSWIKLNLTCRFTQIKCHIIFPKGMKYACASFKALVVASALRINSLLTLKMSMLVICFVQYLSGQELK